MNCSKGCLRGTAVDENIDDVTVELTIGKAKDLIVSKPMSSKVTNIAATAEEISAQSESIQTMSEDIQVAVEDI